MIKEVKEHQNLTLDLKKIKMNIKPNKEMKNKLTIEEEKELFNIWKKGRENALKRQFQEMKNNKLNKKKST